MVSRKWTCPTCGAEYTLGPPAAPIGTRPAAPQADESGPLTERQGKAIYALREQIPDGKARLAKILADDYGVSIFDDLTQKQASELITRLQRMLRNANMGRSKLE